MINRGVCFEHFPKDLNSQQKLRDKIKIHEEPHNVKGLPNKYEREKLVTKLPSHAIIDMYNLIHKFDYTMELLTHTDYEKGLSRIKDLLQRQTPYHTFSENSIKQILSVLHAKAIYWLLGKCTHHYRLTTGNYLV